MKLATTFDEKGYSVNDVESYATRLSYRIKELGVEIIETPFYEEGKYNKNAYIDYDGLEKALKSEMKYNYYSRNAVDADVKSAAAIMLLRNGDQTLELEKAKHIFVSSSSRYCSVVSRFLGTADNGYVPVAYSETDLSSLVWLRNYSTHKDYPKSKLIENAMMILEVPSPVFLTELFSTIDKLQRQGEISSEEAIILRQDYYTKKEVLVSAKGDAEAITEVSVKTIRDKLKEKYIGEENKKSELNFELYRASKKENDDARKKARSSIINIGKTIYEKEKKKLTVGANILLSVILLVVCGCMIFSVKTNIHWQLVPEAVLLIVDIIGFIDLIKGKKKSIGKWIELKAKEKADVAMDKKREEYKNIFENIEDVI